MMKNVTLFLCCIVSILCTIFSASAQPQCPRQDYPDCTCLEPKIYNLTICIDGTNYNIMMEVCDQNPVVNLIVNSCRTDCNFAQNKVTWIKRICVPAAIQNREASVIYNAIICATDLCTNNFLGVVIPNCDVGSGGVCPWDPNMSVAAYCHILAFPKCYNWVNGCIEKCDGDNCNTYCYVERRYCVKDSVCMTCKVNICDDHETTACTPNCTTVECGALSFSLCCP